MKTKRIRISNQPTRKLSWILGAFITWLLPALLLIATVESSFAASATWVGGFPSEEGNWNISENWTPPITPHLPGDTATFALSNTTNVFLSVQVTEVDRIMFTPAATNPYTITANLNTSLTLSGKGIMNNSATTESFVTVGSAGGVLFHSHIDFTNSATAGSFTLFTNNGGQASNSAGGSTIFHDTSTAANGTFTNNGATVSGAGGGQTEFDDTSTAANGTFTNNGATVSGGFGGVTVFTGDSHADSATLIATGGTNGGQGGTILLGGSSHGDTARVEVFGNGSLDISSHDASGVTVGSIEGDGNVVLGSNNLTVGNNMSTIFSGVIQEGGEGDIGSLTKVGTGTLTLSGDNTYTGATTITAGILSISSDANLGIVFSSGPVPDQLTFNGGTLQVTASFDLDTNRGITLLGGGGTIGVTDDNVLSYGGVITGAGSLIKTDTGTLVLSGANTYTGITKINAGVLSISNGANLGIAPSPAPVANQLTFNGGTLQVTASFDLDTNRGITLLGGGGTIGVTDDNVLSYGGVITGAGSLTKTDTGTLVLFGVNTYTGATAVNGGNLRAGVANTLPSQTALTVATGATFDLNYFTQSIGSLAGAGSVTLGAATLTTGNDNTGTDFSGVISGQGGLTKVGTGTQTLSGANTYTGLTMVSAGILNIQNGSALGSTTTGTTVSSGATLQLQGGISVGAEALTISRVGAAGQNGALVNVSGTNNYGGLLTFGTASTISSDAGTLNLTNTGTITGAGFGLTLTGSGIGTISSIIGTGTGTVTKNGNGEWTLSGANTYTGATTVNGGSLAAGAINTLPSQTALTVATGVTFDLNNFAQSIGSLAGAGSVTLGAATLTTGNNNNSTDFSGVISGLGGLTKVGTGTQTLSGENTYAGVTAVNGGSLAAGAINTLPSQTVLTVATGATFDLNNFAQSIGSLAGAGSVTLGAATLTTGNNNNSTDFSGVISGLGGLTKVGTGTQTLSGENTYAGATTVNGGSLIVDGSIASAQTFINAGGLLGGQGFLGGSLVNSGIVSPGDSPSTLTVNGDYTQNANGTLRIEVAGIAPGQFDLLSVGGHASLAGTLQLVRLGNFQLQVGDKVTFLTAAGGVSGTFSTVQNPFISNTLVKAEIIILANAVQLEGTQGSFTAVACNSNTLAVAKALDSAVADPSASGLIEFLDTQPLSELCDDLDLIAPDELPAMFNIGVSLANIQTVNLARRMEDIRAGSSGFSATGFTINTRGRDFNMGLAGPTGPEGKSGPSVMQPTPQNRWGVFMTGLGEFTDVDDTSIAPGYYLSTGGLTFGVDYRVSPNFAIGLTGGYADTNANLVNNGSLDVNGGTIGAYATGFAGGFYVDAAAFGTFNGYDSHRTALLGTASGDTDGQDFNALAVAGYDWKRGGLTIGPLASFQYTYVGLDGFTEHGSLAPLSFNNQNAESTRTALGAKASYDWRVGHVVVKPELRAAWQHEFGDTDYSIVSRFASGAGNSFTVNGPAIGRDSLLIGTGAAVLLNQRVSVYAYYDSELARTNYTSNNVSAGFRVTF